jgi:hypothetical protein
MFYTDTAEFRSPLLINDFIIYVIYKVLYFEQGSSVIIVSGYGLDNREIEVRSPAEAGGFLCADRL